MTKSLKRVIKLLIILNFILYRCSPNRFYKNVKVLVRNYKEPINKHSSFCVEKGKLPE